jgi:hypothetical protein
MELYEESFRMGSFNVFGKNIHVFRFRSEDLTSSFYQLLMPPVFLIRSLMEKVDWPGGRNAQLGRTKPIPTFRTDMDSKASV